MNGTLIANRVHKPRGSEFSRSLSTWLSPMSRCLGITGLQLLDMVKNNPATHEVAFIIVTGGDDEGLKRQALDLGAADLLSKPVHMDDLVARLRSVLRAKLYEDALKEHMKMLEQRVRERTAELNASRLDILWKLGKAAEYRDSDTGNHIIRVGAYRSGGRQGLRIRRSLFAIHCF